VSRDDGRRRIVLSANVQGRALSAVVADIRQTVGQVKLPEGYFITLGGQFQAQEEASRLVGLLSVASLLLMFVVLYGRYKSTTLSLLVMVNIPLALVGAVFGLWISGQPLSVAALIGFITLAGISVRNGILKISHYLNLMRLEGERFDRNMILRGSLERPSPVLMTALVTAFALAPFFELVARPEAITLYVRDHGKGLSTQGASARLTLLTGTEKSDVALTHAGENRLEARGAFKVARGTKAVAVVTLPGRKTASVRFAL